MILENIKNLFIDKTNLPCRRSSELRPAMFVRQNHLFLFERVYQQQHRHDIQLLATDLWQGMLTYRSFITLSVRWQRW